MRFSTNMTRAMSRAQTLPLVLLLTAVGGCAPSASSGSQEIDGGLFSWPNGVTMTTSVVGFSPIEEALEDGNWDLSEYQPGTHLLELRYEVSVPVDYERSFTRAGWYCPGAVSSLNGAGDSVTGMEFIGFGEADSPSVSLNEDIFPGGTKWGVATYVVSPEASVDVLILQTSCGGSEERVARQSLVTRD